MIVNSLLIYCKKKRQNCIKHKRSLAVLSIMKSIHSITAMAIFCSQASVTHVVVEPIPMQAVYT